VIKPPKRDARTRAWQRMLSGRRLDVLNPSPLDIEIEDIAHGLARVARWNGQTLGPYALSVAQHSLHVEQVMMLLRPGWPDRWRLATLLHDAPEYVVGDLISPFKAAIGSDYKAVENRLLAAIHVRFGLPPVLPAIVTQTIKRADRIMAYFEARHLAGFSPVEASRYFGKPRGLSAEQVEQFASVLPWDVGTAQAAFLARYAELAPV
jgi:5'-deoxynucleotidase YfbR-like HD superfamily hydrolase